MRCAALNFWVLAAWIIHLRLSGWSLRVLEALKSTFDVRIKLPGKKGVRRIPFAIGATQDLFACVFVRKNSDKPGIKRIRLTSRSRMSILQTKSRRSIKLWQVSWIKPFKI